MPSAYAYGAYLSNSRNKKLQEVYNEKAATASAVQSEISSVVAEPAKSVEEAPKSNIPAPSWKTTTNMDNDPQPEIADDEPEDE